MVKFFDRQHVYESDWETVTSAWWEKYPNSEQPHVRRVDTVQRKIDPASGDFSLRRAFHLEYGVPAWAGSLLGMRGKNGVFGYGVEDVECSRRLKRLAAIGHNYTFRSVLQIKEECIYEPHPTKPHCTLYTHRMYFSVAPNLHIGQYFSDKLESAARDSALSRANVGIGVMDSIVSRLSASQWKARTEKWAKQLVDIKNELVASATGALHADEPTAQCCK